jgi:predicted DNA-binding transcriptional regulator AlpA
MEASSQLMRRAEVVAAVHHSAEWIRLAEIRGDFPRRVQTGPRSVAWRRADIEKWVASLEEARA